MISIIIPAHNEEKRITKTLDAYCELFKDDEIIISLNACTDKTLDIVKTHQMIYSNLKYIESPIGAKGHAVIEGFKVAKGDYIGFVDADSSTTAEEYYRLYTNLINYGPNYDGIIASRYMKGSDVSPKQSFRRIVVSRIFNTFVKCMLWLPYHDTQCGAKIFKREAILKVLPDLKTTKWAFDIDLLYQMKRNIFKVQEVPTVWSDKEYSKLNFLKAAPNMFLAIMRLRLLYSPFKFIVNIYNKIK